MNMRVQYVAAVFAWGLVLAGALGATASAKQPECKAIDQTSGAAYNSTAFVDPLGTAIAEAGSGDTIKVIGTCHGHFVVDKDLTLVGRPSVQHEDGLSGDGSGIVLRNGSGAELTVKDLTITGGDIGVSVDAAGLAVVGARIAGNGRGVVNGSIADTTVQSSVVEDNQGSGISGGLFGSITVVDSVVRRNGGGGGGGGGISAGRAGVTVDGSLIGDNGGPGVSGSRHLVITHSVIEGNTTGGSGGGIAAFDLGTLDLRDSIVRDNTASRGGGIFLDRSLFPNTIVRSVITGNRASDAGGGVYGPGEALLSIADSTVSNNSARNGGGLFLFLSHGSHTEVTNSTVTRNTAAFGGGIWNDGPLTLTAATVAGNTATWAGGGIYGNGTITLSGPSTLCGNNPDDWVGCS
jgi:predicted outer membrane repeat protein